MYGVLHCKIFFLFISVQRLQAKVLKLVDISYGGENGFNQAIELSAEVLSNVKFIQEKKLIGKKSDGVCTSWYSVQRKRQEKDRNTLMTSSFILTHCYTASLAFFCALARCVYIP